MPSAITNEKSADSSIFRKSIVVFTGRYASISTIEHIEAVADRFPDWEIVVVQQVPPTKWGQKLRRKFRAFVRYPMSCTLEIVARAWQVCIAAFFRTGFHRTCSLLGQSKTPGSLSELSRPNVRYCCCPLLHSTKTLDEVRRVNPWLGVSLSAPVLHRNLFTIPSRGTINLHKSRLPDYRGMPPGFWEIHDGARTSGVSVHWVTETLDGGDVICQEEIEIPPYSTPKGLATQLDILGTEVLLRTLELLDAGSEERQPQAPGNWAANRTPRWLLARQVARRCWQKRRVARTIHDSFRTLAKDVVLAGYAYIWAPLRNLFRSLNGHCHVCVLLYHRVDDTFVDDVTVGVEQFERHLRILDQKYDVLDLPAFLATRGERRTRPSVVIVFDDGYASNYLAAVLLRRHGLPATFFVSTGMIDTELPFPHDAQRLGYRVPALTWKQIEEMAMWGFRFGSHTVNHVRLSAFSVQQAHAEILGAVRALENHVGADRVVHALAYPYGKHNDMSDVIRNSLAEIGIHFCMSAYGGANRPYWNPTNVLRNGIAANITDTAFRAVVEGWRVRVN